jgi:hypothetical protein
MDGAGRAFGVDGADLTSGVNGVGLVSEVDGAGPVSEADDADPPSEADAIEPVTAPPAWGGPSGPQPQVDTGRDRTRPARSGIRPMRRIARGRGTVYMTARGKRTRPGADTARRRRATTLPLWGLLALAVAGAGLVVEVRAHPGRDTVAASLVTAAPGSVAPTGPFTARDLQVRPGPAADIVTVTWIDPSGGTAIPIVALSTASGQTVAVATLRPGTAIFSRAGLDPRTDYCAVVALYTGPDDTSAVGARACLHRG